MRGGSQGSGKKADQPSIAAAAPAETEKILCQLIRRLRNLSGVQTIGSDSLVMEKSL
ncbi:hypothetical protein GCM10017673_13270 [Streptosporangium violaceochromogenes]|nr:hypothetical protein GCM10017673_13270 [Streptosporangium violaceochromogenes]